MRIQFWVWEVLVSNIESDGIIDNQEDVSDSEKKMDSTDVTEVNEEDEDFQNQQNNTDLLSLPSDIYTLDLYDGTVPARYLDMCGIPYIVNDFLKDEDHSLTRFLEMFGEPDEIAVLDLPDEQIFGLLSDTYHDYRYHTSEGCTYYARYVAKEHTDDISYWKFDRFYVDYDDITEDIHCNESYEYVYSADYSTHMVKDIRPFLETGIAKFRGSEVITDMSFCDICTEKHFSLVALEKVVGQLGLLRYFDDSECYISRCFTDCELLGMTLYYTGDIGKIEIEIGKKTHHSIWKEDLDEYGIRYE